MAHKVTISASEVHRGFGKLLKRIFGTDEHLVIERDGFPVAVMMSYQEYQKIGQTPGEKALNEFGRAMGKDIEAQGLTEEALLALIDEDRQEFYEMTYGKKAK